MNSELFHGSFDENLTEIHADGLFGGVFAGTDTVAESHGKFVYRIESPRPLTNFELNYQIEGVWATALEIAAGDESIAEAICEPDCHYAKARFDGDLSWKLQKMRGQLAAKLGYTSVEMRDEHGTTWLCLPGCEIVKAHTLRD
jgi:hypothetical protein